MSAPTPPNASRVRLRGGGFSPRLRPGWAWLTALVVVSMWQAASGFGWVNELMLPSPARVSSAFMDLFREGEIWRHLAASLQRIVGGWVVGTAAGLILGFGMGISTVVRSSGVPFVSAFFPIPKIALLPLFILWLGIGEVSKLATIAFGVFFPTVVSTYTAIDSVPRNLIRMGQSFDLSPASITWKILLPGALPGILAGFRISSSIALILVVAAEMIGAEYGVGALILTAGHLMQTDRLVAGVLLLSILGVLVGALLNYVERRLLRWR